MSIDKHIEDAALLGSLALIILPIFTTTRETALIALGDSAKGTESDGRRQKRVIWGLVAFTAVVFLAGLPLWVEAITNLSPFSADEVARSLFVVTWLLLLLVIGWQVSLACKARKMIPTLRK